jgi:hypothetical protein
MEMQESPNTPHMKRGGEDMEHGRHEHHKRAKGGKAVQEYNAVGSKEADAAEDEDESFEKGGKVKRKAGGKAEGEHAKRRGDRAARGRHMEHEPRKAGGRAHEEHEEREREHERRGGEAKEREAKERDHRARGGRMAGHSPYSTGRMLEGEEGSTGAAAGKEGQKVPAEPG